MEIDFLGRFHNATKRNYVQRVVEHDKANLLYRQLTCEGFHRHEGWRWLSERAGYTGDTGFIYFE